MRLVNPEYLMLAGIQQLSSLKVKETLLHSFVLLVRKGNGKLLLVQLPLKAHGITMA
jgi:hypothetical protein